MSIEPEITTLHNGLRVVTHTVPSAQSAAVACFVGVGSRGEGPRTNGASHYLEHMLFKGTPTRTALEISQAIEGVGGALNAYTTRELTCFWNNLPFEEAETGIAVIGDMLQHSLLAQEEIDRERTVVQQEIRRTHDNPSAWASELLGPALFGDQPVGWPVAGTLDTVGAMTRDDLAGHVERFYTTSNCVLSVSGNVAHEPVVEAAERHFGGLRSGEVTAPPAAEWGLPAEPIVVETRDIEQTNLVLAAQAPHRRDPDRYAVELLHTILGRGMSSRLFKEVRERRGLAYSIGSRVARLTDIGTFIVSAGVSEDQQEEALTVIAQELQTTAEELVDDEELQRAKDYAAGSFRLSLETSMAMGQRSGEQLLMDGEIESPEDTIASIRAVTADDVRRVARGIFGERKFALTVVGPSASADRLGKILAA